MMNFKPLAAAVLLVAGTATAASFLPSAQTDEEMEMPKPMEQHVMIQKGAGEWEGTLTMSMPGMESETKATESVTKVGAFHTMSHFECEFMGAPYLGVGLMTYDPQESEFVSTWADSMSPTMMIMRGQYDEAKKAIVQNWDALNPMTGEMAPHRSEMRMGDDSYTLDFYMGEGDAAAKTMTIKMKRKK